jgi:hypothetical protein
MLSQGIQKNSHGLYVRNTFANLNHLSLLVGAFAPSYREVPYSHSMMALAHGADETAALANQLVARPVQHHNSLLIRRLIGTNRIVGHWPRHSLQAASSTTQIAVIFCESSNPTERVIDEPPTVRINGRRRPIAALSADQAPTAIIGCPHISMPSARRCNTAGGAGAAVCSGRRARSPDTNSLRITPSVRSDLISDRDSLFGSFPEAFLSIK